MPVDSPTVPKALVTSKRISTRDRSGSSTDMIYVPVTTTPRASRGNDRCLAEGVGRQAVMECFL